MSLFSADVPAERLQTALAWTDLKVNPASLQQIRAIANWIKPNSAPLYKPAVSATVKAGSRALFDGPPGTDKQLAVTLLGKQTGREVFRVDVPRIVSNYIGETEKKLSTLFDRAEKGNWILFFDEADALFGKRTEVRDAHDKYANQEVAYLLQRIENYPGLVILATNKRANIDDAFVRRCQAVIHFP